MSTGARACPTGRRSRCRSSPPPSGAGRACTRGQLRGVRALSVEAEVARGAWHRALDPLLHGLRRESAEEVLRPLPQGRRHLVEEAAEGPPAGALPGRAVLRAVRERMAARPDAVDEAL